MSRWQLLRDIGLTGTAIFVIISQVYALHPSDVLLATALGLTAPSVADHAKALLRSPGGGHSSASHQEPPPSPPGGSSPGSPGE